MFQLLQACGNGHRWRKAKQALVEANKLCPQAGPRVGGLGRRELYQVGYAA